MKTRWAVSEPEPVKKAVAVEPVLQPGVPRVVPLAEPETPGPKEAPTYTGRKRGRPRAYRKSCAVRTISIPADIEARIRRFMRDQRINVSGWVAMLIDDDLKARGYF
jgi:hypothetical protein